MRFGLRQLRRSQSVSADAGAVRGPGERVDDVPAVELASVEAPLAVDPSVAVPVLEYADVPLRAFGSLQLVAAVDDAACVVGSVEVDDVVADEVHAGPRPRQQLREPRLERVAALAVGTDPDVGHEQRRQRVHVA